jgi:hypothetical protein
VNSAAAKRVIGPLSPPPSAYTEDVVFTHPGGDAELRCTYERDGAMVAGGLRFKRVRAYRFRAEGHCTPWHIEGAYDTLVEVEQSEWVGELLAAEPSETWGQWKIRHFLIYLDGAGAYEVAAEDVEWLPEASAS